MVKEAEANREADEKRKEEVELKNKAEQFILQIDRSIEEGGDKITDKQKEEANKIKDELKKAIENNDIETLRSKIDELEKAAAMMQQYAEKNKSNQAQDNQDNQDNQNNQDVVDADFKEKKLMIDSNYRKGVIVWLVNATIIKYLELISQRAKMRLKKLIAL